MPHMIPDIDPRTIPNNGERLFYSAAAGLPDDYTVCYSFKYAGRPTGTGASGVSAAGATAETAAGHTSAEHAAADREGEADFVIVHPALGYVVVEVKQGEALYANGLWHEFKDRRWVPLSKDPIEQARKAMYAIRDRFREVAGPQTAKRTTQPHMAGPHTPSQWFPLQIKFAICFPECTMITGYFPAVIDPNGVLCFGDLDRLEEKILALFGGRHEHEHREETDLLINRVLAPTFKVFARLDDQIEMFHSTSAKVLTEEQERILAETELDKRKVFLGAAGTGKTFLAMEKARRLERGGRRVFLTCFNRNLARYVRTQVPSTIMCCNFHDYLIQALRDNGQSVQVPEDSQELSRFYDESLPTTAFMFFAGQPPETKFDSIIVDEGQDFKEDWFVCLESMLGPDGEFYIFADPSQDVFKGGEQSWKTLQVSKHRLTRNLRNTEPISNWLLAFVKDGYMRPGLTGGLPVVHVPWSTVAEEKRLIEREAGRLVSQGIKPWRIVILSPNRLDHSSLHGCTKIKEWPLEDFSQAGRSGDSPGGGIRFATVRSFKGLEADIVFLIGLKAGKQTCTPADIYVGGSRGRFLLYLFYNKEEPPPEVQVPEGR